MKKYLSFNRIHISSSLFLLAFLIFLGALAIVGCKKIENLDSPNIESSINSDSEEVEEIPAPEFDEEEPYPYQSEATTKIASLSMIGNNYDDGDATALCSGKPFKYAGALQIGNDGIATHLAHHDVQLVLMLSQADVIDSLQITIKDKKTGQYVQGMTYNELLQNPTNPLRYTFYASVLSDTFTVGTFYFRAFFHNGKNYRKSAKVIGVNQDGHMYGTAGWGVLLWQKRLGLPYNPVYQTYGIIDRNYIPQKGDRISYDVEFNAHSGIIINDPIKTDSIPPKKVGSAGKPAKYTFKVAEMNANCNSNFTTKTIKVYVPDLPTGIKSSNKTSTAIHYNRKDGGI